MVQMDSESEIPKEARRYDVELPGMTGLRVGRDEKN
jgi:hypothetical protein